MTAIVKQSEDQAPIVHQNEGAALIGMIERAARDPNVDINKMERLFEMHQKMQERQAVTAFNAAMSAAQAEMPTVTRNKDNTQTKSKYADLYAIADEALPTIHKHGFGLSFSEAPATKDDCLGVSCRATHSAGHSETYHFNVPLDGAGLKGNANKTVTHAYGSTFTYGRRYATCGVFNIVVKDNDGNAPSSDCISEEQQEAMKVLLVGNDDEISLLAEFLRAHKIEHLSEFPARNFDAAMNVIRARRSKEASK